MAEKNTVNEMILSALYTGLREPRQWQMGENSGTTYRVGIAYFGPQGIEQLVIKIDEENYMALRFAQLPFGTPIELHFAPRVVIRDNQQQLDVRVSGIRVQGAQEMLVS